MAAISIDSEQFSRMLAGEKPLLVDFWAPWCVHCRRLQAAFDTVADSAEEMALTNAEGIEIIPTLVLYKNGQRAASVVKPGSKAAIDAFLRDELGR